MKVSVRDIEYVAELSKLELSNEEKEQFAATLNDFLNFSNKLAELDIQGVKPTIHVLPIKNVFREDEVQSSMDREFLLNNAVDIENGCFRVPKVVE